MTGPRNRTAPPNPPSGAEVRSAARADIQAAALELFLSRGFDAVSGADIAARVGVSERTFFRHFASKDEAAFRPLDDLGPLLQGAILSRPDSQAHLPALRDAFIEAFRADVGLLRRTLEVLTIARTSRRLRAGIRERQQEWEAGIADVVAVRLGTRADQDPRPRVWTAIAFTVVSVTLAQLDPHNPDLEPQFEDLLRKSFDTAARLLDVQGSYKSPI